MPVETTEVPLQKIPSTCTNFVFTITGSQKKNKWGYKPSQNIGHKLKKYSKIGQDFKNIISNFAWFFDSYCQRLISGRKTGTRLRLHPNLTFF